jgi:DNA modification methylase
MRNVGGSLVIRGDARALPLADASVDLVVTSPPYWALRSYSDAGEHYAGQIGSESTPAEYIAELLACTREWLRVLKPSGSIWVDLGDKYDSGTSTSRTNPGTVKDGLGQGWHLGSPRVSTGRPKSLLLLPERYRIACVDELGLTARAVVVWSKPNALPESVTDRVRRSHEDWVHLTKGPRYFAAVDEIREPHSGNSHAGRRDGAPPPGGKMHRLVQTGDHGANYRATKLDLFDPRGKLPGSVWEIPSEPLNVPQEVGVDHFAAFPTEWPRRIILGWSPSGICAGCGDVRRPAVRRERIGAVASRIWTKAGKHSNRTGRRHLERSEHTITGYVCGCPNSTAPTRPAVVLDPFGGTGTTALVAATLGRVGVSVDRSADYCRLARWRTTDPGERARALRLPKPEPVAESQLTLDLAQP